MKYNKEELNETMRAVDETTKMLWGLAEELVKKYTAKIYDIINPIKDADVEQMTTGMLRQQLHKLSMVAFDLAELRDKTSWNADIAEIIRDEAYAIAYNTSDGPVAQRTNNATIAISKDTAISSLKKMVSSRLKSSLDETHRLIDSLKSQLISRASDQKLVRVDPVTGEII